MYEFMYNFFVVNVLFNYSCDKCIKFKDISLNDIFKFRV